MTAELATNFKAAPPSPMTPGSVQSQPRYDQFAHAPNWVMQIASIADTLTPWGQSVRVRDAELRAFWPTEPVLASALYTVCIRNAMQTIELDGPPRTVRAVQDMFDSCEDGQGIEALSTKVSEDLYTQDNAAFIELVGREKPSDPVISLNHLDAAQCRRTGIVDEPVVWNDPLTGEQHRLKWYQVAILSEMPSPVKTMFGVQYCALTRLFRAAQIIRDVGIMNAEKASGRFADRVHLVGGVQTTTIEDKMKLHDEKADNRGLARYVEHIIIGSLDPTATVSVATLDLKEAPGGFDYETWMKWYINNLAMAFGEDYQTFAPLPGGRLGSSEQSKLLDLKSKGKGPKAFTKLMIKAFRQLAVIPKSVTFGYEERDASAEQENANVSDTRATTRAKRIASGEITVQVARNIAQDDGDLSPEYLPLLEAGDANADISVSDEEDAAAIIEDVNDAVDGKQPVAVNASVQAQSVANANAQNAAPVGANGAPMPAEKPITAKDLMLWQAVQEVRDSRELLERSKEQAESEDEVKPADAMKMALEVGMTMWKQGLELGQSHAQPAQPSTDVNLYRDKAILETLDGFKAAIVNQPPAVITVQPANVIIPEQKQMDLTPLADAFIRLADAVQSQPAPQVQVPVTVEIPKVVSEHTTVRRDADGNMTGTDKSVEYAE